jgi:hypothetical protein
VPPPNGELVTANVFSNNAAASEAQTNIYTMMSTNYESYYLTNHLGDYSDELTNYSMNKNVIQLYTNSTAAANSSAYTYLNWGDFYQYIYDANAVINGLQITTGCSPAVKQQLTGEAYFIRAYWHFYLTNAWGAVPLVLTTNYNTNATLGRTPRLQVLQQVVADLEVAQKLLNTNYVDGSDTVVTTDRVRPNKAAATALLARAWLYLGDYSNNSMADYQKADSAASTVITNSTYSLSPLSGVFLENSSEAIWQLQTPSNQSADTPDGEYFILLGAPQTGGTNCSTLSQQLMASFEPGDQRSVNWVGSITDGGTTYYFPYKYKNYTSIGTEYEMVLRLGEQYLIRAEARAHEGNIGGAAADLNMIRARAGLAPTTAATAADLSTAILHERQVELFSEWGHRWFDLCRTGNAPSVMGSPGYVTKAKGGVWNPDNYQLLLPIPQLDITTDHNLTQNAGY